VALAYVIGFAFMLAVIGWHPDPGLKNTARPATAPIGAPNVVLFRG